MKPTFLPFPGALLPGGVLSGMPLALSLCWVISSVASSAGAESLAPQAAQAPPAPAQTTGPSAQSRQAEQTPPERLAPQSLMNAEAAPERASLHLSVGFGGGSVGVAARAAADVEYWLADNAGIGLLGALGGQSAVLGSSFSYAFVGPALTLRDSAMESNFFATVAGGFMNGSYTNSNGEFLCFDADCDPVQYDMRAPGVVLNAGLTGRAGSVDLGGALAVDLISAELEKPRWLHTVTLNFIVGIPLL